MISERDVDAVYARSGEAITAIGELARALVRCEVVVAKTPQGSEILRRYNAGETINEIGAALGIGSGPVKAQLRQCGVRVPA